MVFSSLTFLFYFLPITIALYYMASSKFKNLILLAVSLFFYAWGEPVYILLMIFSIVFNFAIGWGLYKSKTIGVKKMILAATISINLLNLGFFKYGDFLLENLSNIFIVTFEPMNLPLPIGISFYTFQAMSYIIDLYKGQVGVQKNIINFGAYISLFPQLIAGPIVRMKTVEDQLIFREHSMELFSSGVCRFILGLGKKVLLANNAGLIWTAISETSPSELSVMGAWIGIVAFTFQIYFDFSGYSDMAIGLGRMFGFQFLENFNYPYTSKSITEFWRRWHISLSTWFKEYVYIPLGGNKKGMRNQIRNIFLVWILTGLWHGASWNFIIWGIYFGIILVIEKMLLGRILDKLPNFVGHIYAIFMVIISWTIFAIDDFATMVQYLGAMFGKCNGGIIDQSALYYLTSNFILFLFFIIGSTRIPKEISVFILQKNECNSFIKNALVQIVLVCILLLSVAHIVSSSYNPFLYFRF